MGFFREYCLSKTVISEVTLFDINTLCFKVGGKVFAIIDIELFESANLKYNLEYAIALREQNSAIVQGFHMNKKHWNTVFFNKGLSDKFILELVDHSYNLVVQALPKRVKDSIQLL
jgi:predicted DNA-binding protein (MmcQ/YjbR family)